VRFILHPRLWLLPILLWGGLVFASYIWGVRQLEQHLEQVSWSRGRFVFELVESIRLWNARHGGVYAPVSEGNPPNPYLPLYGRDIQAGEFGTLTKINPAYMTRQLADLVSTYHKLQIHITSLKPLNPINAADDWESEALNAFEKGTSERFNLFRHGEKTTARYMAPLVVRPACLACHAHQGYQVGDVRGGISVTFNTDDLEKPLRTEYIRLRISHLATWLLLSGLSLLFLQRQRRALLDLKYQRDHQESLVRERTQQLSLEVKEREHAEEQLRSLLDSSGEGMFAVNTHGECIFCNPAALRMLGYKRADVLMGRNVHTLIHHSRADHSPIDEERCPLCQAYADGSTIHTDSESFWRADGTHFPVEVWAHPIHDEGELVGSVINFSDITTRKELHERIWHQANYDPLTGQPNRNLFNDRLEQTLTHAAREGRRASLMFIDLDMFKQVNDRYGHDAGDLLLQRVAERISRVVRASDTLARIGGDEFTLLLDGDDQEEGVTRVGNELLDTLSPPFNIQGEMISISASIGVACYPEDADNAAELLRYSDQAMYFAKKLGRNRLALYRHLPPEARQAEVEF